MADARLEVSIGRASFTGEGTQEWLSGEFERLLKYLSSASADEETEEPAESDDRLQSGKGGAATITVALGKFLQDQNAATNQVRKFLATAFWLQDRGSLKELTTADVAKALKDNHQSRLGNAAKELGRNIAKGYCEKTANGFFVTAEGKASFAR